MTLLSKSFADTHSESWYQDRRSRVPIDQTQQVRVHYSYPSRNPKSVNNVTKLKIEDREVKGF